MQNFELRLVIVILKLVMWMNRLDIWITIIQIIQNFVEFRPLKVELLLRESSFSVTHLGWSVRKVCVSGLLGKKQLAQSRGALIINRFLKAEVFCHCISFAWFFLFLIITFFYLFYLAMAPTIKPPPSKMCWTKLPKY